MRTVIAAIALAALTGCERTPPAPADPGDAASSEAPDGATTATGPAEPEASDKPLAIAAAAADLKWGGCPPGMPEGCEIAVLHGDPAKPGADIFLKVPGGAAIPPHWHSSSERMTLVSGQLEVHYKGAAPATLNPGNYAFGPARLPHRADCKSSEPCTLFIAFDLPVDLHDYAGTL